MPGSETAKVFSLRPDPLYFNLEGRIESNEEIVDAYYTITRGSTKGTREKLPLDANYNFNPLITFDDISKGESKAYVILIEVDNGAIDSYWEYAVQIVHDLEAPDPLEVRVDNKILKQKR